MGDPDVPVPAGWADLHHSMVLVRRVSLVSVDVRGRPSDVVRGSGPGRAAGGDQLVVREQSSLSLVWRDRFGHGVLHDPEGNWPAGLQLSFGDDRVLDLRTFLQLDRNAALG